MRRLIFLIVLVPVAVVLIVLSVANRQPVTFSLDPFNAAQPALSITWPFFVFLFVALLSGLVIGGTATWLSQGRHRRAAREKRREADRWHREADEQRDRADQAVQAAVNKAPALDPPERAA